MAAFERILVANRGEIAVRVIRCARALGYHTIAVYSDVDAGALHVAAADQAVFIGAAPAMDSYLNLDRILRAALVSGAQAVHPGYGFLSESAAFARRCRDLGLIFIGPPCEAIELMGNKATAKQQMAAAGIACVPGYDGADSSDAAFIAAAERLGFPVMVKAAAGGGGRGMRRVDEAHQMRVALEAARSEARAAFGSDQLILEKVIDRPRHVEIQVIADHFGTVIHLGERDCSVQRRHQKVIEEAPSPAITPELRAQLGRAAVTAARCAGYENAGTVEFLLDEAGNHYFLEMNTRLQVEHPVTEMITGLDLVALQIRVAQGQRLELRQEDIHYSGHAIEARLYAEDPGNGFLPSTGRVLLWQPPEGSAVRVDHGLVSGDEVSTHYDPMIAKVIAWGEDRETARRRLVLALERTVLLGIASNKAFLVRVLRGETFSAGLATTALVADELTGNPIESRQASPEQKALAAVLLYQRASDTSARKVVETAAELRNFHSAGHLISALQLALDGGDSPVTVTALGPRSYDVDVDGKRVVLELLSSSVTCARFQIDGIQRAISFVFGFDGVLHIATDGGDVRFADLARSGIAEGAQSGGDVLAPMHGRIVKVLIALGDQVQKGTALVVLEGMKMEHWICAAHSGTVIELRTHVGAQVAAGQRLLAIAGSFKADGAVTGISA